MLDQNQKAELLEEVWELSVKLLREKIKDKSATPTDIANALKTCRENGITIYAKKGEPILGEDSDEMTPEEIQAFFKSYKNPVTITS